MSPMMPRHGRGAPSVAGAIIARRHGGLEKVGVGVAGVFGLVLLGGAGFVVAQARSFDASMSTVDEVPLPEVAAVDDPEVIARGEHLAKSLGACVDCHGDDLGGKAMPDMGTLGVFEPPNATARRIDHDTEIEREALWVYLQGLPPKPFGER